MVRVSPCQTSIHAHLASGFDFLTSELQQDVRCHHLPLRLRSVILKLRGQNALDDTILAPSFMLENMLFNCKTERQTNLTINVHRIYFISYDINTNSHRHLVYLTWNSPENLQNILTLRFKSTNTSMHTHQQRYTNTQIYTCISEILWIYIIIHYRKL